MAITVVSTPGPQGPRGLNWKGTYDPAAAYAINDGVSYGGSSWIALTAVEDVTPGTAPLQWGLLAQQGTQGDAGVTWRGNYNAQTAYSVNDGVSYQGSSYIAVGANTGVTPGSDPTKWSLLAQGGSGGGGSFSAFYVVAHGFSGSVPSGYTQVTQDANNLAVVNMAAGSNVVAIATGGVGTVQLVKNASAFTVNLIDADGLLSSVNVQRV